MSLLNDRGRLKYKIDRPLTLNLQGNKNLDEVRVEMRAKQKENVVKQVLVKLQSMGLTEAEAEYTLKAMGRFDTDSNGVVSVANMAQQTAGKIGLTYTATLDMILQSLYNKAPRKLNPLRGSKR